MRKFKLLLAGDPSLRKISLPVENPGCQEVNALVQRLIYTANNLGNALGLAAPQVGKLLRIFIYKAPTSEDAVYEDDFRVVINPEIIILTDETTDVWESCFCLPGLAFSVPRFNKLKMKYFTQEGEPTEIIAEDKHARIIQHEFDHLEGVLLIDKLKDTKKFGFTTEIKKFHLSRP